MAEKNNIRSIRFSNEVAEIIDRQQGKNFTEKFERLIYNCYMLISEKEKEAKRLDEQIKQQKERLSNLRAKADILQEQNNKISISMNNYQTALNIVISNIEKL